MLALVAVATVTNRHLIQDCCIWCRHSPSRSLYSSLVGRLKSEWRVWLSMFKAATPSGCCHTYAVSKEKSETMYYI